MVGVVGWGPTEQRISPSRDVPFTVSSSFSFFVAVVSCAASTVVWWPYPRLAMTTAVWGAVMLAGWLITRRWRRAAPPLGS
jgi:hypothetical protein